MKKIKNKKIIIIATIIFFIILAYAIYDFTPLIKAPLANYIYGTSNCSRYDALKSKSFSLSNLDDLILYEDANHPIIGGDAITSWKCSLCFRGGESSTTNTPKLCDICAKITNRCSECGGKLNK